MNFEFITKSSELDAEAEAVGTKTTSNIQDQKMKIILCMAYDREKRLVGMDIVKEKDKKGLILKTWERCKSFHGVGIKSTFGIKRALVKRSISLPRLDANNGKSLNIAPKGCFSVYVGPQKQRFVIKAKYANHPLFKAFLVEAESEYGYRKEGPLELPCDVNEFVKVLLKIDNRHEILNSPGFIFGNKEHKSES